MHHIVMYTHIIVYIRDRLMHVWGCMQLSNQISHATLNHRRNISNCRTVGDMQNIHRWTKSYASKYAQNHMQVNMHKWFIGNRLQWVLPYSTYNLQVFNFANFVNLELFAKLLQWKFWHLTTAATMIGSRGLVGSLVHKSSSLIDAFQISS